MIQAQLRGQDEDVAALVRDFPAIFYRAAEDWAKFKAGQSKGLFAGNDEADILDWYAKFPDLWELVRPNFVVTRIEGKGAYLPLTKPEFAAAVDEWVDKLGPEVTKYRGLGIAPLIIAGVIIAGALGIAGAIWAVGYVKQQDNISRVIDEVVAGRLSEDVLIEAINKEVPKPLEGVTQPLESLGSVVKWLAIGVLGYFAIPVVSEWLAGRK